MTKTVVSLLALAVALTAAATAGGGTASSPCQAARLAFKLAQPDAGVGHRTVALVVTNRGSDACSLSGYPGLRLLDSKRRLMETHVSHGAMYFHKQVARRLVVLRPGKSARAWLEYSAVPTEGEPADRPCQPLSAYLRVTPPGSKSSGVVKFGDIACGYGSLVTTAFFA